MPGVLQLEAMAQVAGVMLNLREEIKGVSPILCRLITLNFGVWSSRAISCAWK